MIYIWTNLLENLMDDTHKLTTSGHKLKWDD
jgi:hypothetical protein